MSTLASRTNCMVFLTRIFYLLVCSRWALCASWGLNSWPFKNHMLYQLSQPGAPTHTFWIQMETGRFHWIYMYMCVIRVIELQNLKGSSGWWCLPQSPILPTYARCQKSEPRRPKELSKVQKAIPNLKHINTEGKWNDTSIFNLKFLGDLCAVD